MSSDSKGLTLELTPESERLIQEWGKRKEGEFDDIVDSWLISMAAWMLRETDRAFDTGKQPGGAGWPPNVGRYKDWKASLGSYKPGILNGNLRRSMSHEINKASNTAKIGSTEVYARAVYYGKSTGWGGYVTGPGGASAWFQFSGMRARPYFPTVPYGENYGSQLFNDLIRKHIS